jgi:hypothetical protein
MRKIKNALLVLSCLVLVDGCSREGSVNLQPGADPTSGTGPSASGNGTVKLAPGEADEVYSLKTNLPPGGHIDVGATNGKLTFKPDTSPTHTVSGQSIATKNVTGFAEKTPAFVTPEAREILKRRPPAP